MKYIWESHDIITGRRLASWNRAENYIIGYIAAVHSKDNPAFVLISLCDGMVVTPGLTREALAVNLNEGGYRPNSIHEDDALGSRPPTFGTIAPLGVSHG